MFGGRHLHQFYYKNFNKTNHLGDWFFTYRVYYGHDQPVGARHDGQAGSVWCDVNDVLGECISTHS